MALLQECRWNTHMLAYAEQQSSLAFIAIVLSQVLGRRLDNLAISQG